METGDKLRDRVADLEAEIKQLRRAFESRVRDERSARPVPFWWVRTMGEVSGSYYESNYPEQDVNAPTCELPAVYLDCTVPDDPTDKVIFTPRSTAPQIKIVSPGGWIPEHVRVGVIRHHDDRMHAIWIPELRVVVTEATGIDADDYGTVRLYQDGAPTSQLFKAWNDWLHGGTVIEKDKECRAILDEDVRRWSLSAGVEC